ncbi:MAG TPA: hypothetical protein DCS93_23230 [Microscillaceae bacterium]|nr:hypothetical protein [Microscillaceae bacterium]
MAINASFLTYLLDFAACRGMNRRSLQALLSDSELDLMQAGVSIDDYGRVWTQMITELEDEYLGLAFGMYLNLGSLGLIHQISLSAHSIEQALKLLEDYLATHFPIVQIHKEVVGDKIKVTLQTQVEQKLLARHILDANYVVMFRELGMMLETKNLTIQLPYEDLAPFERQLRTTIAQGSEHCLIFDTQKVNESINQRNMRFIEVLLPKYLMMLEQGQKSPGFATLVKQMILRMCAPELPTFQQVKAQFAMSDRTFQRRLTNEGQSFRAITNAIKKELASYLREGNQLKTQDIAYILGYSEASAYLHAAREWFEA